MPVITNGQVLMADGTLKKMNIYFENGKINAICQDLCKGDEIIDAGNCIVAPGLVDIHIHGASGADFSDGHQEGIDMISKYLLKQGVTAYLGTTMSLTEEQLNTVMGAAAPRIGITKPGRAVLWGINMEGPFIAPSKKGGQNGAYIRNPDIEMFLRLYEKSGKSIRLVDIAPEMEHGMEFITRVRHLCRVSLAHTDADYDTSKKAFECGATHMTHLFNAMAPINHRSPGIIVAAAEDAEFVEIICDGKHLHPAIIRFIYQLFGKHRVCIVSDSMRACGLADGEYELGGQKVFVKGDLATLTDGTLAGSTTSIAEGMRRAVKFGIPIEDALLTATYNPAKAAGLDHVLGSLQPGRRADMVFMDKELQVKAVYLEGQLQEV